MNKKNYNEKNMYILENIKNMVKQIYQKNILENW